MEPVKRCEKGARGKVSLTSVSLCPVWLPRGHSSIRVFSYPREKCLSLLSPCVLFDFPEATPLSGFFFPTLQSSSAAVSLESESIVGHVWLFVTSWTVARQASLSMGFSRRGYWSGKAFPTYSRASSQARGRTWVSRIAGSSLSTKFKCVTSALYPDLINTSRRVLYLHI